MPKYKDSFTDEHFMAKLESTPKEPVLHLALRHPDLPYGMALDGWPAPAVVMELYRQIEAKAKDQWYPVSVRLGYRKHILDSVEPIDPVF